MLRKISNLGTALSTKEQKSIQGGYVVYEDDYMTVEVSGNWGRPGEGVTCFCDGIEVPCSGLGGC
ncbi:hypothetical protein [uncultured Dokdonia sp.]|uniref:hypothetical protein n=1 Tax=uncultured Dokdonia sp. TaxID=575653 RepID=UPI00261BBB38|nr:hypothetical protein [uncultured Dokdonia sp.]